MRTATRWAWRVAGFAAFGATAALAVALSSYAPSHVSLDSVSSRVPACARPAVRIQVLPNRLKFTNSAAEACQLTGYPAAEAAAASGPAKSDQPGGAAQPVTVGRLASRVVRVTLRHGTSAYASLAVSSSGCRHPAMIGMLRVRLPGDQAYSSVDYRARACSLWVGAFQRDRVPDLVG
jgi:hypothetical protein